LPPSLLLSWWLLALLRWRKAGGDERVRPRIDLAGYSAKRGPDPCRSCVPRGVQARRASDRCQHVGRRLHHCLACSSPSLIDRA
jgi:hypothetical protein